MQTALPTDRLDHYKSKSQRARVATEAWGLASLYCPVCATSRLRDSPTNTHAFDFSCGECAATFQLKAQSKPLEGRIVDSAYSAMVKAIREDRTPNLFAMHYSMDDWRVENMILIPHFAFPLSAIEKRKPLGPKARRAGWVGCNILLGAIPEDARIPIVVNRKARPMRDVREQFQRIRKLESVRPEQRGWALDVLNVLRRIGKTEFSLSEVYSYAEELQKLHPNNRHVEPKIRQQLQVLRDKEFLEFVRPGEYRMRK
jgi:type II restriction enzyme